MSTYIHIHTHIRVCVYFTLLAAGYTESHFLQYCATFREEITDTFTFVKMGELLLSAPSFKKEIAKKWGDTCDRCVCVCAYCC